MRQSLFQAIDFLEDTVTEEIPALLYPKTFDQLLKTVGDDISNKDISPYRRIPGEIIFEPLRAGVRVTARDEAHRVLWGFVSSKETLGQPHVLVGVYDIFKSAIAEELKKVGLTESSGGDPIKEAEAALAKLEGTVASLRKTIQVKKVSDATLKRARLIASIASEADDLINLQSAELKGRKARTESDALFPGLTDSRCFSTQ
jgi:hypothetical protein